MLINRVWQMPNSNTFSIPAIHALICKYASGIIIDPFANTNTLATVTNDLDPSMPTDYHMDATDFYQCFTSEALILYFMILHIAQDK